MQFREIKNCTENDCHAVDTFVLMCAYLAPRRLCHQRFHLTESKMVVVLDKFDLISTDRFFTATEHSPLFRGYEVTRQTTLLAVGTICTHFNSNTFTF